MDYSEPKTSLMTIQEELQNLLKILSSHNNLRTAEAKKLQNLVYELQPVIDSLEFYDNHPFYMLLHSEMHRLFKGSVPIDAFIIKVNLKPNCRVPALLEFNLFPTEQQINNAIQ